MRDKKTPELLKEKIRAAFVVNGKLSGTDLSASEVRKAHFPQAEKLLQMIEEHHKTFNCDHGRDEYLFAQLFINKTNLTSIPSHKSSWKDYFRL
ncbi:MAG: hypothetical protein JWM96_906 [Alphaproteobacteria bacterium]|nr:hypothetical protein [Alphaproteobacteria bacterium]